MTPEEKAVIDAAIADHSHGCAPEWCGGSRHDPCRLMNAIESLLLAQKEFEVPRRPTEAEYGSLPILDPTTLKTVEDSYRESIGLTWTPATLLYCLAGDHIRIGTDETDVLRSNRGVWNVSKQQMGWKDGAGNWQGEYVKGAAPWFPAEHRVELRLDLSANPGFRQYPADTPCEILCTPERLAVLTLMTVFPGTKEIKP